MKREPARAEGWFHRSRHRGIPGTPPRRAGPNRRRGATRWKPCGARNPGQKFRQRPPRGLPGDKLSGFKMAFSALQPLRCQHRPQPRCQADPESARSHPRNRGAAAAPRMFNYGQITRGQFYTNSEFFKRPRVPAEATPAERSPRDAGLGTANTSSPRQERPKGQRARGRDEMLPSAAVWDVTGLGGCTHRQKPPLRPPPPPRLRSTLWFGNQ